MEAEPDDCRVAYEPQYDAFRCLTFRDGDKIDLQSKKKSLNSFFPQVVAGLARLKPEQVVLDDELVIPGQSFETLQLRLNPATSRSRTVRQFPSALIVF